MATVQEAINLLVSGANRFDSLRTKNYPTDSKEYQASIGRIMGDLDKALSIINDRISHCDVLLQDTSISAEARGWLAEVQGNFSGIRDMIVIDFTRGQQGSILSKAAHGLAAAQVNWQKAHAALMADVARLKPATQAVLRQAA
ncbi:hypothetical protein HY493_04525 [Candidatus Woesearchaeota archaeon]|nr:hypothetical protein [Candidatus Woesearchaeota archaeon]